VKAADPVTLLTQYQELARTTQDIVSTDVPSSVLGDVVDLAFHVKDAGIRSVVFDNTVIDPAYPDYDHIRALVQQAISPAAPTTAAAPQTQTTAPPAAPSSPPAATPSAAGNGGAPTDVANACAYDPAQASAALAAGQPPTKNG
jgi:hypothetical protein